ncbi:MAG: CDP-glucose 4,6-dehydratase [Nitrospiraceae bacterium]|nr:MAG: CDP-glucose 4,6-dehydratase [Nitrospiraceae bacterium]
MLASFWRGKKVFVTGHTGFKGSWLCLWLAKLGADVTGYSLEPPTDPNLYTLAGVRHGLDSINGDVRDLDNLCNAVRSAQPEIVFHLAAQSLVLRSYRDPIGTLATNIMGTAHVLEAVRRVDSVRSMINVTSDKCYENKESVWGYRENDPMGGYDPYSCSKGCSELVTSAFRNSFFGSKNEASRKTAVASVRAGNVIGGGDWAEDRLVPDIMRAVLGQKTVVIRNPKAIRPWQHVLDPLYGYLLLAEKLYCDGNRFSGAWNFGPAEDDTISVAELITKVIELWGNNARWETDKGEHPHEAGFLKLDCTKARMQLKWKPGLGLARAVEWTVDWYKAYGKAQDIKQATLNQIEEFEQIINE